MQHDTAMMDVARGARHAALIDMVERSLADATVTVDANERDSLITDAFAAVARAPAIREGRA